MRLCSGLLSFALLASPLSAQPPTLTCPHNLGATNATAKLVSGKPHTIVIAVRDQTSDTVGLWRQSVHF